jgi:hypothetical protein
MIIKVDLTRHWRHIYFYIDEYSLRSMVHRKRGLIGHHKKIYMYSNEKYHP